LEAKASRGDREEAKVQSINTRRCDNTIKKKSTEHTSRDAWKRLFLQNSPAHLLTVSYCHHVVGALELVGFASAVVRESVISGCYEVGKQCWEVMSDHIPHNPEKRPHTD